MPLPQTDRRLRRIAAHLFTWPHLSVRQRMIRRGIQPVDLFGLNRADISRLGFPPEETDGFPDAYLDAARHEVESCRNLETEIVFREDPGFPPLLAEIFDPPDFVYVAGRQDLLQGNLLAVVGSRRADAYGRRQIQRLIPPVCTAGVTVVSGMAWGIDSMAHGAALECGGNTVGVNAAGMDHLHPPGNRRMLQRIRTRGCIVCEAPLGTTPRPFLFPLRNRIISGLSRVVLVVQGTLRSGSLITARMALDQNRELMAVPGPVDSPLSAGPHLLIQQGAKLVGCPADILEEFGLDPGPGHSGRDVLSPRENRILDLIEENEVQRIDDIVETLSLPVPVVVSLLLDLTMKGFIREEGDGYRIRPWPKKH